MEDFNDAMRCPFGRNGQFDNAVAYTDNGMPCRRNRDERGQIHRAVVIVGSEGWCG